METKNKSIDGIEKDDLFKELATTPQKYFVIGDEKYLVDYDGDIYRETDIPEDAKKVDAMEYLNTRKIYKYVMKKGDKYFSYFDNSFEYKIGQVAIAENDTLYAGFADTNYSFPYKLNDNSVLIELKLVDFENIEISGGFIGAKHFLFVDEVNK